MAGYRDVLVLLVGLVALFNPPSALGPFVAVARRFDAGTQKRMARSVAVNYAVALVVSTWVGQIILGVMSISLSSLRLAGGLVLTLAALPMVMRRDSADEPGPSERTTVGAAQNWRSLTLVPLTFPLAVGGASVATVITASASDRSAVHLVLISAVCLAVAGVVWVTFRVAPFLARRMSKVGLDVLTVVSGTLLLCIALQIFTSGLRGLLPGLSH